MFFIIYKTTNLKTGSFYIGKHRTDDLNDGYLGSGILLKRAIGKYGVDAFEREILFVCSDEEAMNLMEQQLVTEELLNNPKCYNLAIGGQGGFLSREISNRHSMIMKGRNKYNDDGYRKSSEKRTGKNKLTCTGRLSQSKKVSGTNNVGSKRIRIGKIEYPTLTDAANALGVCKATITYRLKTRKDYQIVGGYSN